MSYTDVERILLNLKIIGMLRQHERFSTQNNTIEVEPNTYLLGVRRWFRGERREVNIEFLRQVFNSAFSFLDAKAPAIHMLSGKNHRPVRATSMITNMPCKVDNEPAAQRDLTSDGILFYQVAHEVETAILGMQNLQTTYERDYLVVAQIQVMIDSIRRRLEIYKL